MGRPPACHCICGSELCSGCDINSNLSKIEITCNGSFSWGVTDAVATDVNYVQSGVALVAARIEQYASNLSVFSGTITLWKRQNLTDIALGNVNFISGYPPHTCMWYQDFPRMFHYAWHNSINPDRFPNTADTVGPELEMLLEYVPLNELDSEDPWNREIIVNIDPEGEEETTTFTETDEFLVPENVVRLTAEVWSAGACGGVYEAERSFLPSVDITNVGLWVAEGSSPLWQCINELPVSNSDYIYSPADAICTYETKLSAGSLFPSPAENNLVLHYRMCKSNNDGEHSIDVQVETSRPSGNINSEWTIPAASNIDDVIFAPSAGDGNVCSTSPPASFIVRAADSELDDAVTQPSAGDGTYLTFSDSLAPNTNVSTFELQATAETSIPTNITAWMLLRYDSNSDAEITQVRLRSAGTFYTGTVSGLPDSGLWAWVRVDFSGTFTNPSIADYAIEITTHYYTVDGRLDVDAIYLECDGGEPPFTRVQQWSMSTIDVAAVVDQYDLYILWRVDAANLSNVTSVRVRINGSWFVFTMDNLPTSNTWVWAHGVRTGNFASASTADYILEVTAVHSSTTGIVEIDAAYLQANIGGARVSTTVSLRTSSNIIVSTTHPLTVYPTDYAIDLTDTPTSLLTPLSDLRIRFVTTASGGNEGFKRGCSVFGARLATTTNYVGTGGGGGGGYNKSFIGVAPETTYPVVVGVGGTPTTPDGGTSSFSTVVVSGGKTANNLIGGAGGSTSVSSPPTTKKYSGGNGGTASITGGGGGSSAGVLDPGTAGGDGDGLGVTPGSGGAAPTGGGDGGEGGDTTAPSNGEFPGGGGGGLGSLITNPGNGADGKITLTYQPWGRCGRCLVDTFPNPFTGDIECTAGELSSSIVFTWQCANIYLDTSINFYLSWGYPPNTRTTWEAVRGITTRTGNIYYAPVPYSQQSLVTNKQKFWVLDFTYTVARALLLQENAYPLRNPLSAAADNYAPPTTLGGFDPRIRDTSLPGYDLLPSTSGVNHIVRYAKAVDCETDIAGAEIELQFNNYPSRTVLFNPDIPQAVTSSVPTSVTVKLL
jgi:hypothetical protein